MIEIVPFKKEHVFTFKDMVMAFKTLPVDEYGQALEKDPIAFTALKDGEILGAAGIHPIHEGVGLAWTLLLPEIKKEVFFLHRAVKSRVMNYFEIGYFHRIEMIVKCDHAQGINWANHLGFTVEAKLRKYGVDQSDFFLYSLVK